MKRLALAALLAGLPAAGGAQESGPRVPAPSLERVEPRVREAIELRRRAVLDGSTQPADLARRWGELGLTLHAHDFRDAAALCYSRAADLAPRDPRWPHLEGLLLFETGDFATAAEAFGRALAVRPQSLPTLLRAGEARRRALDLEGARRAFEGALVRDAESAAAHCGLGAVALQEGKAEVAARRYEACAANDPAASRVHAVLASLYRRLGDEERAAVAAERAGLTDVTIPDPYLAMVKAAAAHGDVHLARGSEAFRGGRFEAALAEYEQALDESPDDPRVHRALGTVNERLGRLDATQQHYRRAVELDVEDVLSRFNLASLLARQGQYAAAIPYLEEVLERDPGDREAARNLAWLYTRDGRLEQAAAVYDGLLAEASGEPELRREAAMVVLRLGRLSEATALLEEAATADPADGASRLLLAGALAESGRFAGSAEHLEAALRLALSEEQRSRAHYLLGLVREQQGLIGEAVAELRESLRLAPAQAAPGLELARLLAASGRCGEAREVLDATRRGGVTGRALDEVVTLVEGCEGGTG